LRLLLKTALPHNQAQGFTSGTMAGRDLPPLVKKILRSGKGFLNKPDNSK